MFSPGFFKESLGGFRGWLDDLLLDSWRACQDAAVLIESPSTMSGIHIAEALKIPYFRAFTVSIEPSCEIFIPSCPCPLPWTVHDLNLYEKTDSRCLGHEQRRTLRLSWYLHSKWGPVSITLLMFSLTQ